MQQKLQSLYWPGEAIVTGGLCRQYINMILRSKGQNSHYTSVQEDFCPWDSKDTEKSPFFQKKRGFDVF